MRLMALLIIITSSMVAFTSLCDAIVIGVSDHVFPWMQILSSVFWLLVVYLYATEDDN